MSVSKFAQMINGLNIVISIIICLVYRYWCYELICEGILHTRAKEFRMKVQLFLVAVLEV